MDRGTLTSESLPSGANTYHYAVVDVPGTVAANNYISLFNPSNSGKTYILLAMHINNYSVGASSTANSMVKYRITAASGGSVVATNNIAGYDTTGPTSTASIRTGNPTVTTVGPPGMPVSPPIATGAGDNAENVIHFPAGTYYLIHPGEGVAYSVAAGNTNQVWTVHLIWCEF